MDDKLKCGIASIRFPMALLVVLIHCTLNTEQPFLKAFMDGGVGKKLATIAVPIFFFLSGYLFEEGCSTLKVYKQKNKKKSWKRLSSIYRIQFFGNLRSLC